MKEYTLKRWRGQHLLNDRNMLRKIVSAADLQPTDTVVEVGAGTGNLTVLLAQRAQRVIAIEIDSELMAVLRERVASMPPVEIIHDDARTFNPRAHGLSVGSYAVVANIPYNITSLLIRKFLEANVPPSKMILLIQKEVALRICAQPPHMSLLSVAVQYYADPRILFSVPRTCFTPKPNVDSAVIEIVLHTNRGDEVDAAQFFRIVTAGFAHKRKYLISNLSIGLAIPRDRLVPLFEKLGISLTARAQELILNQWQALRGGIDSKHVQKYTENADNLDSIILKIQTK